MYFDANTETYVPLKRKKSSSAGIRANEINTTGQIHALGQQNSNLVKENANINSKFISPYL
jgi:hypothetical protein